ncbi:conserved phage C-terminal domain-containing protein [Fusobacterium polymorphum]|uniref:conserved phage C-terminal domain-containing protein n=1 Tax=Fusobacterium nucleatum subsp. polymorphum TaxID=76857 RepID=UPI00300B97CF
MEDRTLKQLLMSSNYYVLNKQIIKTLGIESTFLLTALIEASDGLSDEKGWFYKTAPSLEEETGLSKHKQSNIIDELIRLEILEQENKGMPMKRFFRINFKKIEELVFKSKELKNLKPGSEEIERQGVKNFNCKESKDLTACSEKIEHNKEYIINNLDNNNLINNNLNKELNINIHKSILDYLNGKLGTRYRATSKNIIRHINARLNEGYTFEDFKIVIDKKFDEWIGTEFEKYLCPDTLFGTKFEKYLNQNILKPGNKEITKNTPNKLKVDDNVLEQLKARYGVND